MESIEKLSGARVFGEGIHPSEHMFELRPVNVGCNKEVVDFVDSFGKYNKEAILTDPDDAVYKYMRDVFKLAINEIASKTPCGEMQQKPALPFMFMSRFAKSGAVSGKVAAMLATSTLLDDYILKQAESVYNTSVITLSEGIYRKSYEYIQRSIRKIAVLNDALAKFKKAKIEPFSLTIPERDIVIEKPSEIHAILMFVAPRNSDSTNEQVVAKPAVLISKEPKSIYDAVRDYKCKQGKDYDFAESRHVIVPDIYRLSLDLEI